MIFLIQIKTVMYMPIEREYKALARWQTILNHHGHICFVCSLVISYCCYGLFMAVFYPYATLPLIKELSDDYDFGVSVFPSFCAVISGFIWLVFLFNMVMFCKSNEDYAKNAYLNAIEWTMGILLFVHLFWAIFGLREIDKLHSKSEDIEGKEKQLIDELLNFMVYQVGIFIVAFGAWSGVVIISLAASCIYFCPCCNRLDGN